MTKFNCQVRLNFIRIILRNKRFFLFDMMLPIIFYLLYTKVLTSGISQANLKMWNTNYLISMIIYSCLLGSVITVSNTLLEDHTSHFDLFTKLTPLPRWQYYLSLIIIFMFLNVISSIAIILVGIVINHISLNVVTWLIIMTVNLLGTIPLIFVGILISLLKNSNTINLLNNLIVFPLAMISGLWWPIDMMPKWLQTFGKLTPTFELSTIDKSILYNKSISLNQILGLTIWLLIIIAFTFILTRFKHKELT